MLHIRPFDFQIISSVFGSRSFPLALPGLFAEWVIEKSDQKQLMSWRRFFSCRVEGCEVRGGDHQ